MKTFTIGSLLVLVTVSVLGELIYPLHPTVPFVYRVVMCMAQIQSLIWGYQWLLQHLFVRQRSRTVRTSLRVYVKRT